MGLRLRATSFASVFLRIRTHKVRKIKSIYGGKHNKSPAIAWCDYRAKGGDRGRRGDVPPPVWIRETNESLHDTRAATFLRRASNRAATVPLACGYPAVGPDMSQSLFFKVVGTAGTPPCPGACAESRHCG